jgi:hypothetical protein
LLEEGKKEGDIDDALVAAKEPLQKYLREGELGPILIHDRSTVDAGP